MTIIKLTCDKIQVYRLPNGEASIFLDKHSALKFVTTTCCIKLGNDFKHDWFETIDSAHIYNSFVYPTKKVSLAGRNRMTEIARLPGDRVITKENYDEEPLTLENADFEYDCENNLMKIADIL